jgi:two-component system, OmpR family, sensor histidine kinase KdpD
VTEARPDPDALLVRVKEEEARQRRGRLKVFFGAAAGVGKTYAMLEAAREQRADSVDVVVGHVDTHGRVETEALLDGLEILPPRAADFRGTTLREFDLDGALARRPALILVDELAHTNAPGSRHAKRWQDVLELLDAGINVYTTVNVQHVESLNDVVAKITGVVVRETVPDSVLEQADEVELIDLPPDDLLQRFKDGKVYMPEQAEEAVRNFFRKGNLIALRELALRSTAERVDAQMRVYMREHAIRQVWPAAERLLVCIGPTTDAARLVRSAKRMAEGLEAEWIAAYVETSAHARLSTEARDRVTQTLRLAEQLGA